MPQINKHLELVEIVFGLHFIAEITLDTTLGDRLYRQISKAAPSLFTTKLVQPGGFPFLFQGDKTQLTITDSNLLFTNRKEFDHDKFRKNSELLATRLLEVFEVNEDNIKLAGKIFRYKLNHPKAFDGMRGLLPAFASEPVHGLRIRPTLKEQGKNIHIQFQSIEKDRKTITDQILIECDVNNEDQNVGHKLELVGEVIRFADEYNQKRFPQLLSEKLGITG